MCAIFVNIMISVINIVIFVNSTHISDVIKRLRLGKTDGIYNLY